MAMLAVFPACERNTCWMQQVLDGGTKVGVIAVYVVSSRGGRRSRYPDIWTLLVGSNDGETEVLSSDWEPAARRTVCNSGEHRGIKWAEDGAFMQNNNKDELVLIFPCRINQYWSILCHGTILHHGWTCCLSLKDLLDTHLVWFCFGISANPPPFFLRFT